MNKFLVKFLLIGFIGIAVFGFLAMGHDAEARGGCLAATVNRSACPAGIFDMVSFYSSAFKNFSLAIISLGINFSAFIFVLTLVFAAPIIYSLFASGPELFLASRRFEPVLSYFSKRNFSRWLSLHENSPSLA